MKANLESIPVQNRGAELESETEEEKLVLESIWNTRGGPIMLSRKDDGNIQLVLAPTVEEEKP